jgi:uncharacterized protein
VTRPAAALVVLAKAPEPGRVKTRLCPPATPQQAAELAAAALLDTLDAAVALPGAAPVVVLTGRLPHAARAAELAVALRRTHVLRQRGDGLGHRIAAAHADTAALLPGRASLQVGMDTPQAGAALLAECLERLHGRGTDAVLGPATDGGWWALGLRDPRAAALVADVPTSRDDTGARTVAALRDGGLRVGLLPELTDVDTAADAVAVAAAAPAGRFAEATARCRAFGVMA